MSGKRDICRILEHAQELARQNRKKVPQCSYENNCTGADKCLLFHIKVVGKIALKQDPPRWGKGLRA